MPPYLVVISTYARTMARSVTQFFNAASVADLQDGQNVQTIRDVGGATGRTITRIVGTVHMWTLASTLSVMPRRGRAVLFIGGNVFWDDNASVEAKLPEVLWIYDFEVMRENFINTIDEQRMTGQARADIDVAGQRVVPPGGLLRIAFVFLPIIPAGYQMGGAYWARVFALDPAPP